MRPLIVQAAQNQSVPRPPVWIMRQAGRYLSEYRALKQQHGFFTMCRTPELATEVTMQPIRYLDVDAAVIFSDIMVIAEPLGLEVEFSPGPKLSSPIKNSSDIAELKSLDVAKSLHYVFSLIRNVRIELEKLAASSGTDTPRKAVLGFAGAPWTLACYLIDQGPYKHFQGTQVFAQKNPEAMHTLLDKITTVLLDYLSLQVEAGADLLQLFDSWVGNLNQEDYKRFALPYTQKVFERIKTLGVPGILYSNAPASLLEPMKDCGASGFSIDSRTTLLEAREILGSSFVVQGNLDPTYLFCSEEEVVRRTKKMLSSWSSNSGYIANLGHGILPETPRENALAFVNTIKEGCLDK